MGGVGVGGRPGVTQAALQGAAEKLGKLERPGACATDAAATFVLTLVGAQGSAQHLGIHDEHLLGVAQKTLAKREDQATLIWTDSSAHLGPNKGPLFWQALRLLFVAGTGTSFSEAA